MSGAKWICFCGSANIKPIKILHRRKIYVKCIKCDRRLLICKYGMTTLRYGGKVKHHVVLLTDSIHIPGSYITEEWNLGSAEDNDIPRAFLASAPWEYSLDISDNYKKLSLPEVREILSSQGFIKREFCPPNNPDSIPSDPELLKAIGGSASLVEIVLSGAAIITLFFFKANGLPKYQKVFELQIPEE